MTKNERRITGTDFPAIPARDVRVGMRFVRLHKLDSVVVEITSHGTQFVFKLRNAAGEIGTIEHRGDTLVAAFWPREQKQH
jgi:hypothetical protein